MDVQAHLNQTSTVRYYQVKGPLFFASVTNFLASIDTDERINQVEIDLTDSQLWDDSAVGALERIESKFATNRVKVTLRGLNEESAQLLTAIGQIPEKNS